MRASIINWFQSLGINVTDCIGYYCGGDSVASSTPIGFWYDTELVGEVGEFISNSVDNALLAVFSVLPDSTGLPAIVDQSASELGSALGILNLFLPVDHILILISILVSLQSGIIIYKITMWLVSIVRGVEYRSSEALDFSHTEPLGDYSHSTTQSIQRRIGRR